MRLGRDGASVMTGQTHGVAALLRRKSCHMTNIHCIAHILTSSSSQTTKSIVALKTHQEILTGLVYYFIGNSKRQFSFEGIQRIQVEPILKIKEVH